MRPLVWIVGDWQHADFSAPIDWLQQAARCSMFDCPAAAFRIIRGDTLNDEPVAMLFLESRPGQFCAADVERLHALSPLARLVALVGPWCEGPQRKSRIVPGIVRVRLNCWQSRLAQETGLADIGSPAPPRTMTETERIERGNLVVEPMIGHCGRVAISTSSRASFQALAEVAKWLGFAAIWHSVQPPFCVPACDVAIFDGWDHVPEVVDSPVETSASSSPVRLLLLHFPRPADISRAASRGIAAVVAQPMLISDLANALVRAKVR